MSRCFDCQRAQFYVGTNCRAHHQSTFGGASVTRFTYRDYHGREPQRLDPKVEGPWKPVTYRLIKRERRC